MKNFYHDREQALADSEIEKRIIPYADGNEYAVTLDKALWHAYDVMTGRIYDYDLYTGRIYDRITYVKDESIRECIDDIRTNSPTTSFQSAFEQVLIWRYALITGRSPARA